MTEAHTTEVLEAQPELAVEQARDPPPALGNGSGKWTPEETWAWEMIRNGKRADFNERLHEKEWDPRKSEYWGSERNLSASFLRSILFEKRYRRQIPFEGVQIRGAVFRDTPKLAQGRLDRPLLLDKCGFKRGIDLEALRLNGWLGLEDCCILGGIDRSESHLKQRREPISLGLAGAEIAGSVSLIGAFIEHNAELVVAKIEGQLELMGATIKGKLQMGDVHVEGALMMQGSAADGLTTSLSEIEITFASIGTGLDLRGTRFKTLDLTESRIDGTLSIQLSAETPRPEDPPVLEVPATPKEPEPDYARLVLRNTRVGTLSWETAKDGDGRYVWPAELQLCGLTYSLGTDMLAPDFDPGWFKEWLKKNSPYSPQPFEHLADVFRNAGLIARANNVLFASRERDRHEASRQLTLWRPWNVWLPKTWRSFGLLLLKWTVGYGIGLNYFRFLGPALLFTFLGVVALSLASCSAEADWHWLDRIAYSVEMLVPGMKVLRETAFSGWLGIYFILHQVVGLALAGCIAAGLAGLTQRS